VTVPEHRAVIRTRRLNLVLMSPGLMRALLAAEWDTADQLLGANIPAEWGGEDWQWLGQRPDQAEADPSVIPWLPRMLLLRAVADSTGTGSWWVRPVSTARRTGMAGSSTATCPQGQERVKVEAMTLDEALRITARATGLAAARGVALAVAVVDAGGHLVTLHRMDEVPFIAAEIAWGKAWTAAAWGETSAEQATKAAELPCSPPRSPSPAAAATHPRPGESPSSATGR
jgi:Haem-degrading